METIISIIAIGISVSAFIISIYSRKDNIFFKRIDSFKEAELSVEIFTGSLQAFGIKQEDIIKDGFSIEQLVYYNNLLNAIWQHKYSDRVKRVRRKFRFCFGRTSFKKRVEIATEMDKKKRFFQKNSQTGMIFTSDAFQLAWEKYLFLYWTRDEQSITSVMIEANLNNKKRTTSNNKQH